MSKSMNLNYPFPWSDPGPGPPANTCFFGCGPTRVDYLKRYLDRFSRFVGLTVVTDRQTDRRTDTRTSTQR